MSIVVGIAAAGWLASAGLSALPTAGVSQVSVVRAASIECAIRARPDQNSLRLDAIVRSASPVSGRYNLSVFKQSPTGTSQNSQSGVFELAGEPERVLTTIVLDRSAIDHYRAQLSLQSSHGDASCTSP